MPRYSNERGSITIWLVTVSFAMIVLVGLAVDLSGQVHAQQRAHDLAAQAARVGGQQINAPKAMRGLGVEANTGAAVSAAQAYLAAAGVTGSVNIEEAGTVIRVTTTDTYNTKFLGIIGLNNLRVGGEASARLVRAIGGTER